jgi:hypothetical protein
MSQCLLVQFPAQKLVKRQMMLDGLQASGHDCDKVWVFVLRAVCAQVLLA